MIGQGLGPGGNFSWWDLKGNNFGRKAKTASDAITIRVQEEKDSIGLGGNYVGYGCASLRHGVWGLYTWEKVFLFFLFFYFFKSCVL